MRRNLKPSSFRLWRKRVSEKSIKHRKKFVNERKNLKRNNMIDEFYDRNVKVIISAKVAIDNLCDIKKINSDFKRTKSRLNEMQSSEYMKKEHKQ